MRAFRTLFVLVAIAALVGSFGCSKKSDTPTAPPTTTTVPAATQTQIADQGTNMATSMTSSITGCASFLDGTPPKGGKNPPYWLGPDGNGWYTCFYNVNHQPVDTSQVHTYTYMIMLKMTPDPWQLQGHPTRAEVKMTYRDTSMIGQYEAMVEYSNYPADSTHINGYYKYTITAGIIKVVLAMDFSNVSILPGNYAGHYTYSFSWPYMDGTTLKTATVSGLFDLDDTGAGTGKTLANDVEVVRYVFHAVGQSPRGYYTLACEEWATQHTFGK